MYGYGNSMFLATHGILARGGTPSASLLLDTYTNAAVAYSLRKLRSAYSGNAIRVRRSSDNTEQDFGFVSNNLDTASLLTFCGAGNGFITTWYDQSGNGLNETQTTATNQPQIVTSGAINLKNGKPCLIFDGTNDYFTRSAISTLNSGNQFAIYSVVSSNLLNTFRNHWTTLFTTINAMRGSVDTRTTTPNNFIVNNNNNNTFNSNLSTIRNDVNQKLLVSVMDASNLMRGFDNGATGSTATYTLSYSNSALEIGRGANGYLNGTMQEWILWNTNQLSNRTGIESNINTNYTIY